MSSGSCAGGMAFRARSCNIARSPELAAKHAANRKAHSNRSRPYGGRGPGRSVNPLDFDEPPLHVRVRQLNTDLANACLDAPAGLSPLTASAFCGPTRTPRQVSWLHKRPSHQDNTFNKGLYNIIVQSW
jgi:hypothetical protein